MREVIEHVTHAILKTAKCQYPWVHVHVQNVFPKEFYTKLCEEVYALDSDKDMMPLSRKTTHRLVAWLVNKGQIRDQNLPEFWKELRSHLFGPLRQTLEKKFSVKAVTYGAELTRDVLGYGLGPHTDTPDKLITGLFYLPLNDKFAQQGTLLYECDTPDPAGKGHKATSDFRPIKLIPYQPNTALFFLRTDYSYHGVLTTPVERNVLAYDLFRR